MQTYDYIERFDNYNAYLIELDAVGPADLREALVDGWLAMAPPALAEEYLRHG